MIYSLVLSNEILAVHSELLPLQDRSLGLLRGPLTDYFNHRRLNYFVSDDWAEARDKAILDTIYYCESCNIIIELGDADIEIHKRDLPHHKMRRVMIVKCGRCGNVVTDSYAQYVQEKNEFWCKNCLFETSPHREAQSTR